jgi:glycosyltransferase involved in cell wall biosynthesis
MADLSEELARRGHQVDVATTRSRDVWTWRTELPAFEWLNGVNVYRFRSLTRRPITNQMQGFGYYNYHRTGNRRYEPFILVGNGPLAPGLAWHILRHGRRYDLIHIQTLPYAHFVYAYRCARAAGRPVVVTPHLHVEEPQIFDVGAFNAVLRGADMVIAVSGREVPYLTARGVARERILVAGNGVRLNELPTLDPLECRARLGLPHDAFVLLFLGRKIAYKGLQSVLAAFAQLQTHHPSLYLVSAGPPTEHSQGLAREYGGLPRWIDLDTVSDAQKLDLLNACDVLLLPSTAEAFGIVFLEAWAVGKPVIGARAGAIPWIVEDGHDGLLVTPGDATDLAVAVERLIEDPALGRWLAMNGRTKVHRRYTVERIVDQIEDGYRRVLGVVSNQ